MLIGKKLGMTRGVSPRGEMVPLTVIKVGPCVVLELKTKETHGYNAVKLGYGSVKASRLSKPVLGQMKACLGERDSYPAEMIKEFRVSDTTGFQIGQEITLFDLMPFISDQTQKAEGETQESQEESKKARDAEGGPKVLLVEGFWVDITGITKGRGTAGVMKRWNFSGGPKSHGSKFKRRPGSIGMHSEPAKVIKGLKMAGHYGVEKLTITGLKVFGAMPEQNLLLVKGSVPGPTGGRLVITPSKRKPEQKPQLVGGQTNA